MRKRTSAVWRMGKKSFQELVKRNDSYVSILKELGYSLRKSTIWRNRWTGNEETLKDLITPDENGIKFRKETEDSEIVFVLENWIPAIGKNTIKEEYDRENRKIILSDTAVQEALI